MPTAREKKSKFTASVNQKLVALVDEKAAKLKVTRSDVVEQAMEMWLRKQAELDEARYFETAAAEMNADAKSWNGLTSQSIKGSWEH
jgi:metal-responsive CopG/Arc/MetJ family transcriptional regulator